MYKNYLFDLDGTLLPMDMKYFVELFLAAYCKKMVPITKIHADTLTDAIWTGVGNMARNDGNCLNSDIFWRSMNRVCNRDMRPFSDVIDNFYRTEFDAARAATKLQPLSRTCVEYIKAHGGKLIVATNPIFPKSSTYRRIQWAGLDVNAFDYITTYDNSSACKPNLNYYEEICSVCGIHPEESIMRGYGCRTAGFRYVSYHRLPHKPRKQGAFSLSSRKLRRLLRLPDRPVSMILNFYTSHKKSD